MIKFFRKIRKSLIETDKTAKYIKYALGEIILVVIGILIALQVNNWNETRLEQRKITEYARSLIQDLTNDIEMLEVCQGQAEFSFHKIDSLKSYLKKTPPKELSNTDLFVYTNDMLYRPFKWNRSTLEELKGSGSLRFITNDSLKNKLVRYEAFSKHLDEDFQYDKNKVEYAEQLTSKIIDFNAPYFSELISYVSPDDPINENHFLSQDYPKAKEHDVPMLTYDNIQLKELANYFIIIQDNLETRAFNELPQIMYDAKTLIKMLEEEYQIENTTP